MKIEHLYDEKTGKPVNMKHKELNRSLLTKIKTVGTKEDGEVHKYRLFRHKKGTHPFPKHRGTRKEVWSGDRLPFDPHDIGGMLHHLHQEHGGGHFKISAYGGSTQKSPQLEHDFLWIEKVN